MSEIAMPEQQLRQMQAARAGDARAFDALLAQYMPMIEHQLSMVRAREGTSFFPEDEKDLRQEAHLAFFRALLSYDVEQSAVSFGLYAKVCVNHALISACRKLHRLPELLDAQVLETLPTEERDDPTRRLREQEDYDVLCHIIMRALSPYENAIWQLYMSGETVTGIAKRLGKDTKSIHNAIYRIRRKLREQIEQGL